MPATMGIKLLPPDVNESDADFTVSGENIRFGLVAIKGIGWGFIEELKAERESGGPFRTLDEFCRRMVPRDLNRRAVESLIKAGAFDSLGFKRRRCSRPRGRSSTASPPTAAKTLPDSLIFSVWAATTPKARAFVPSRCRTCRNSPGRSL